jgi:hypothetical protein
LSRLPMAVGSATAEAYTPRSACQTWHLPFVGYVFALPIVGVLQSANAIERRAIRRPQGKDQPQASRTTLRRRFAPSSASS